MAIQYIETEQELETYKKNCDGLIVNFTAKWCGPCRVAAPIVEQLQQTLTNVVIVKVDLDKARPLAQKLEITSVPTFIIYHKGEEIQRLKSASKEIVTAFQALSNKVGKNARVYPGTDASAGDSYKDSKEYLQISKYIPQGYELLNSSIIFSDYETLNTEMIDRKSTPQDLVRHVPEHDVTSLVSDADSQLLLHVRFSNASKVHTVLVKTNKDLKFEDEAVQVPNEIKVWNNNTNIISFEKASQSVSLHDEKLDDGKWDDNGWYVVKLKYVRFQNVNTIDIFFDGDDEDEHTAIERVLFVGIKGDTTASLESDPSPMMMGNENQII